MKREKQQIKSRKGFTLIELLGTIVIIGIVGTIAVASVLNIKTKSNERFNNAQVETIKQAGQTYFTDNKKLLPVVIGQTNYVALEELIEKNYIDKVYDSSKNEFKTGNDPNGIPYSYVWVKKVSNKEYQYGVHCTDSKNIVYGEKIQEAKKNTSDVKFVYNGFYEPKNKNMIYTSGNNDNTYVEIKITNDNIEKYKYEIYRKTQSGFSQYKTSTNDIEVSNTKIRINANDYEEGEYYIRVTTYNQTSQTKIKDSDKHIYLDKTVPECSITSNYETVRNSEGEDWYSSNSKYNGTRLGENKKLPLKVKGTDKDSGIKKVTLYMDSSLKKENKKLESNAYKNTNEFEYSIGNTKREGNMYYEVVEDNVGNQKVCPINIKVDTTPPTCKETGIEKGTKGNKVSNRQWYLDNVTTYGYFTDANSGVTAGKQLSATLTETKKEAQTSTITQKDRAGNEGKCVLNNIYIDKENPTCESTGGSENWVNSSSANKSTTLIGKCSDNGSGCVAGNEAGKTYDSNGNVSWLINWEGSWTGLSPGTVYDEAGRSTTCSGTQTVKHDWTNPSCSSSGGSDTWVNAASPNKSTTLIGTCSDNGSGCVAGNEAGKTYDSNGNVHWLINWEGNWTGLSPGTVYDNAGNATVCQPNQTVKHDWTVPTCASSGHIGSSWTNQNLYLIGNCSDGVSGCKMQQVTQTVDTEMNNDNFNFGTVEDNAGNQTTCAAPVHTDYTEPSCTSSSNSGSGWTVHDITISGTCSDSGGSGCKGNVSITYTQDTNGSYSPGTVYDNAGNSKQCDNQTVKIDKTKPTITVEMKKGNDNNFDWKDATGDYTNDTWIKGYVNTKATAKCGPSGCKITYTTTGTTKNDTEKEGDTRHINSEGTSYITYRVCNNVGVCIPSDQKTIKLDRTAPTCKTSAKVGSANYNGQWINKSSNNHKVTVTGTCSDSGSGCAEKNVSKYKDSNYIGFLKPGTVKDNVGNETECDGWSVNIDLTEPKIKGDITYSDKKPYTICPNGYSHYAGFIIADDEKGEDHESKLATAQFQWKGVDTDNAGQSIHREGKLTSEECIGSANASNAASLNLKFRICDQAGNCKEKNWPK